MPLSVLPQEDDALVFYFLFFVQHQLSPLHCHLISFFVKRILNHVDKHETTYRVVMVKGSGVKNARVQIHIYKRQVLLCLPFSKALGVPACVSIRPFIIDRDGKGKTSFFVVVFFLSN